MLLRLILLFYTLQVADAGLFQCPSLVRAEVGSSVNLTCDIEDTSERFRDLLLRLIKSSAIYVGNGSSLVVRSKKEGKEGSGAGPLFLYGSLAAASFLLITLLITLVICYRRQNKPDAYLANEPSMYSEIRVTGRAPDKQIAGQRENTGSGGRHARPKIRAATR
ncbi:hypothetical protein HHUSO_G29632 [Huso huso]|uniref:Uncharacterized protein n=1 Tax=Huso huso TaxID=61971 RepID=A0ABR0YFX2_HUSHU